MTRPVGVTHGKVDHRHDERVDHALQQQAELEPDPIKGREPRRLTNATARNAPATPNAPAAGRPAAEQREQTDGDEQDGEDDAEAALGAALDRFAPGQTLVGLHFIRFRYSHAFDGRRMATMILPEQDITRMRSAVTRYEHIGAAPAISEGSVVQRTTREPPYPIVA